MMTSEKAIQLLHRLQDEQFDGIHGDERREALEMAIRALEGDGDTISRKQAIDALKSQLSDWNYDYNIPVRKSIENIERLPSAQPERPEQPESAKEYCAECNHIEMCRWYPYEGCEFRSLPSAQPETHDKRTETHACDLISRQAAIDAVVSAMIDGADAELVEGVMELLPSAQPEAQWIPCSERLPKKKRKTKIQNIL